MKSILTGGCLALLLVLETTSAGYSATQLNCNALLQKRDVAPRRLYRLGVELSEEVLNPIKRSTALNLSYIVPPHHFGSGVLIIKSRHRILARENVPLTASPAISLKRDAYSATCANKRNFDGRPWEDSAEVERYRNYHHLGFPDDGLDRVHADLGDRPARSWFAYGDRCASTSDSNIRPQFLFEDGISDRQPIGFGEFVVAQGKKAVQSVRSNTAIAGTPYTPPDSLPQVYVQYRSLAVHVVPYRKTPDQVSCIPFSVGAIPGGVDQTDVLIIDADDVESGLMVDPQKIWRFQWN
jgi:hypothetical protein